MPVAVLETLVIDAIPRQVDTVAYNAAVAFSAHAETVAGDITSAETAAANLLAVLTTMGITNPELVGKITAGDTFYLHFTPTEKS